MVAHIHGCRASRTSPLHQFHVGHAPRLPKDGSLDGIDGFRLALLEVGDRLRLAARLE